MNVLRLSGLLFFAALVAGCQSASKPAYTPTRAAFYLESTNRQAVQVTLPVSGLVLALHPKPVITEFDVSKVEVAKTELGTCLMFQFNPAAKRDIYRLTTANQGGRLVLLINGSAVGARRIEGPIQDGVLFIFVEELDAALPALARNLQLTSAALQREMARK